MRLLIFDNYDSFTYNLSHLAEKILHQKVDVIKNDLIDLDSVATYDAIILSPGPGLPEESGLLMPLLERYSDTKKILGVCLGHQAIGQFFGAELINLKQVHHGVSSTIRLIEKQHPIFNQLPDTIEVGRYHSWAVNHHNLPSNLIITAVDQEGTIMGIRHQNKDILGIQFHPESVMTPMGEVMLRNWLLTDDSPNQKNQ